MLNTLKTLDTFSMQFTETFSFSAVVFLVVFLWQDGGTALTVASQYGHCKVVDTLLKNGANVHDQLKVSPSLHVQPLSRPLSSRCQSSLMALC